MENIPSSEDESSSDDERAWSAEMKKQYRLLKNEKKLQRKMEDAAATLTPKLYSLKDGEEFKGLHNVQKRKHTK